MSDVIESPFSGARNALAETAGARQGQSRELADMQVTYLMAQQFPRDPVKSMDRILNAFTRLTLAEKSQYEYSRGGTDIRGPSIKAMEAIATEWGNIDTAWRELSRGADAKGIPYSEVETLAVDLQSRTRKRITFIVRHWRDTKQGGYKLSDERDIYELCANMAQRRVRACIEAVIPSDVVDVAMSQADATLKAKADTSAEAMEKMLAAFEPFGVTKAHIEKRIQRRLDAIQPAQVVSLKRVYASLRDGMSEPGDWFETGTAAASAPEAGSAAGPKTESIKSRMRARGERNATPAGPVVGKASGVAAGETAPGTAANMAAKASDELPLDNAGGTAPSYAEIVTALQESQTVDEADDVADLIRAVEPAEQRDELLLIYRQRRDEIETPFESEPPREQTASKRTRGRRS